MTDARRLARLLPAWPLAAAAAILAVSAAFPAGQAAAAVRAAPASAAPLAEAGPLAVAATASDAAGYEVSGATGAYSSVSATWTEPAATCVSGQQDVAFWVGLDGENSASVEQIGTQADCSGGTASYEGWYEMYPAAPVIFTNPVSPGDALSASVTFSGTQTYTLVLSDATAGWTKTVTKNQTGLARSSAEVITQGSESGVTDFGTVTYAGCLVNGTSLGTQNPVKLTMTDSSGKVLVSTSAITKAGKFTNTWLRGT